MQGPAPPPPAARLSRESLLSPPGLRPVLALMLIQLRSDVIDDLLPRGETLDWSVVLSEIAAVTGLLLGLIFKGPVLRRLFLRPGQMERRLAVAQGALGDVREGYFRARPLTPTEADVAAFTIKGSSSAEIASFRSSAQGRIKTQPNAIYRKSGTLGRAQLVSGLVEDLFRSALAGPEPNPAVRCDG